MKLVSKLGYERICSKKSEIIKDISKNSIDAKFIEGNLFRVHKKWNGISREYFNLLENAINSNELYFKNELLYSTNNPKIMNAVFRFYVSRGIIKSSQKI